MGNVLNFITTRKISPHIIFLKDYLYSDKIEILKFLNEDFLVDKEFFLSFFATSENYFYFFDTDGTGLVNLWEILIIILLLKNDTFHSKIQNILQIFTFTNVNWEEQSYLKKNNPENKYENVTITFDEIKFISEIFEKAIIKLYIDNFNNQEDEIKLLKKSTEKYLFEIFNLSDSNKIEEIKLLKLIKFLENDENLKNIFENVQTQSKKVLA